MRPTYTEQFKEAAVIKVINRGNRPIEEVARELGGIPLSTLYGWLRKSAKVLSPMTQEPKSSKQWSAQEKFRAVMEYERLKDEPEKQGEFLRKAGLHGAVVESWQKEMMGALEKPARKPKRTPEEIAKDQQIAALKKDLSRKDQALAETTALLVLKKKAESIWGLVDDEENE